MDPLTPRPEPVQAQPVRSEEYSGLVQQCQRLEKLLIFTLAAFIITTVCASFFLAREAKFAKAQTDRLSAAVEKARSDKIEPLMRDFVNAMQQYAGKDKDFAPIWQKYQPAITNCMANLRLFAPAAGKKSTAPAAAPAPAPKK